MAKPNAQPKLNEIAVRNIPGLLWDDIEELKALNIVRLDQLVEKLVENDWNIAKLNKGRVFFEPAQAERIARVIASREDTPDRPEKEAKKPDLYKISVASVPGLTERDIFELRQLGIGSFGQLVDATLMHDCDLTKLSTDVIIIEDAQSARITDAVWYHPDAPEEIKKGFMPSQRRRVVVEPAEEPVRVRVLETPAATPTSRPRQTTQNGTPRRPVTPPAAKADEEPGLLRIAAEEIAAGVKKWMPKRS